MTNSEPRDVCEILLVDEDARFAGFLARSPQGIAMIPEPFGKIDEPMLRSDAGDFAKWLSNAEPELPVEVPSVSSLVLRSSDIWLPLVLLATDVVLPIYLGLVTSYIYDRMRGALVSDRPRVHVSAEYLDGETGTIRRFNYDGDADAFETAVASLDLDNFFDA